MIYKKLVHYLGGDYLAVAKLFVEVTQHNQVGRGSGHHSRTTYIAKNPEFKKVLQKKQKKQIQNILSAGEGTIEVFCFVFCSTFCAEQAEL